MAATVSVTDKILLVLKDMPALTIPQLRGALGHQVSKGTPLVPYVKELERQGQVRIARDHHGDRVVSLVRPAEDTTAETTMIDTITDAPADCDGFGTRTLAVLGIYTTGHGAQPLRQVSTPQPHVIWQRERYASGRYFVCPAERWAETKTHAFFQTKFTPTPEDTMTSETMTATTPTVKRCSNPTCQTEVAKLTKGLCDTCYRWEKKHGTQRRGRLLLEERSDQETVVQEPAETTTVQDELEQAPVAPLTPQVSATSSPADHVPSDSFQTKVQYLLDLAQQGPEAVAAALRKHTISIKGARHAQGPMRSPGTSSVTDATIADVRARAAAGETQRAIAVTLGLHRNIVGRIIRRAKQFAHR